MTPEAEILTEEQDIDMFEKVGTPAANVVAKAGQSMVARQEQTNAAVTPMAMIDRALASGAAPETLEKLLALQERWEANQGRKAFDEAMSAAKAEIPVISKNRTVDFTSQKGRTHYKHEDLAEIARTVNPILGKHGLSYRFRTSSAANEPVSVTCIVSHRLGYFEENTLVGPRDDSGNKNSLQQVGSTLTYLQRMTLKAALGLAAAEDDDAQAAGKSDGGTISVEQRDKLLKIMEETGTPTENFCQWAKIEAVPELPAADFDKAIQVLGNASEEIGVIEIFEDIEQGTPEWFAVRAGIPTASRFATVMAKGEGKTRSEYMRKLAGEILTGEPMDSYTNVHMDRGRTMEDEARDLYAFVHDADIRRVGFIRNGQKGCSPDSLVGESGGLEIKTALPHIQIERLLRGDLPPEHKAQVQGNLWVPEREWWDFCSYWPKLPPLRARVYRDEPYIKNLSDEVDRFNDELAELVERIRNYDQPSAALKKQLAQSVLLAG